jgi:hypothetical protein
MEPIRKCLRKEGLEAQYCQKKKQWGIRKSNRGDEFDQSTLYARIEISQ